MSILRLRVNLHLMERDPLPVRERTRRAVRDELAQLAKDLFVEKGYDETTIDDLAAAAGMSRRTFFRYFASKEELVMGKYEFFGEQLAEDLAARPAGEPIWASLRQVFGRVVEYFESEARGTTVVAMENIVRDHPTLNASYLDRVSRMQELVLGEARTRTGWVDPTDQIPHQRYRSCRRDPQARPLLTNDPARSRAAGWRRVCRARAVAARLRRDAGQGRLQRARGRRRPGPTPRRAAHRAGEPGGHFGRGPHRDRARSPP